MAASAAPQRPHPSDRVGHAATRLGAVWGGKDAVARGGLPESAPGFCIRFNPLQTYKSYPAPATGLGSGLTTSS